MLNLSLTNRAVPWLLRSVFLAAAKRLKRRHYRNHSQTKGQSIRLSYDGYKIWGQDICVITVPFGPVGFTMQLRAALELKLHQKALTG